MTKRTTALRSLFFLAPAALLAAYLGLPGGAGGPAPSARAAAGWDISRGGRSPIGTVEGPDVAARSVDRLAFDACFGGFPSISADGPWLTFASSRGGMSGERPLFQRFADISSPHPGPR